MSLSSYYGKDRTIRAEFQDGSHAEITLEIPLELILDFQNPAFSDDVDDTVIEFDDVTQTRLQNAYVKKWIQTNLQNVVKVDDGSEE